MISMAVNWGDFVSRRGATPAYVQLANWVTAQIEQGNLQPGDQIPAQRDLAEMLGHSPETAGKAMALLRERRLVETSKLGTFVSPGVLHPPRHKKNDRQSQRTDQQGKQDAPAIRHAFTPRNLAC